MELGLWASQQQLKGEGWGKPMSGQPQVQFLGQLPLLLKMDFLNVANNWEKFLLGSKRFLGELK